MGRRFKGGEASEDLLDTPDKNVQKVGMGSDTRKRTYTVHNVEVGVGSREEVCISTLIFNFLQPIRPARQAGHRSLLQITFVAKSSKKNFLSLESKEEIFLIIFLFSSGKSCHIFG